MNAETEAKGRKRMATKSTERHENEGEPDASASGYVEVVSGWERDDVALDEQSGDGVVR